MVQMDWVPYYSESHEYSQQMEGGGSKKTEYGEILEFMSRIR